MLYLGQNVLAIHVFAVVILQGELVTRSKRAARTGTGDYQMRRLLFLHAQLGGRLALRFCEVDSRVVIDLVFPVAINGKKRGIAGEQVRTGRLEIVVGEGIFSGTKFLLHVPVGDDIVRIDVSDTGIVLSGFLVGAGLMRRRGISENQKVLGIGVLEEIEDPVLLHEARDEVEIGLAVLDAVFARFVLTG